MSQPLVRLLEAAYPNPFRYRTTLPFHLSYPAHVRAEAFDATGQRVALLADAVYPPGPYPLQVEGCGLHAGLYFIRLVASSLEAGASQSVTHCVAVVK